MIRSLVIRQTFLVVDAALVVLALATGVMVVMKFLEPPVALAPAPAAEMVAGNEELVLAVSERGAYDVVLNPARLFGDAGAYDPNAAPPPTAVAPVQETVQETEIPLRLVGTTATEKFASAIVEDTTQPGSAHSYDVGEMVVQDVTLVEVHPRFVMIRNKRNGEDKLQKLSMDDEKAKLPIAAAPTPPVVTGSGANKRVTLNRAELANDVMMNYQDLIKVKPELYRDASGKVVGLTANNIGQIPVAKKLGLNDGDVLQTVNNEPIDSEAKVMEMITKYSNATSFRIGLIRNGKPEVVTYRLE